MHELDDAMSSTLLGTKRQSDFERDLSQTAKIVKQAWNAGDFIEISYWTGRYTVLERYCSRNESPIPAFFHPNRMVPIARFVKG